MQRASLFFSSYVGLRSITHLHVNSSSFIVSVRGNTQVIIAVDYAENRETETQNVLWSYKCFVIAWPVTIVCTSSVCNVISFRKYSSFQRKEAENGPISQWKSRCVIFISWLQRTFLNFRINYIQMRAFTHNMRHSKKPDIYCYFPAFLICILNMCVCMCV